MDANGGDYWLTPSELSKIGEGDCEDIAICLYYGLREKGLPADKLKLLYLDLPEYGHMVLVADIEGEEYVFDIFVYISSGFKSDSLTITMKPADTFLRSRGVSIFFNENSAKRFFSEEEIERARQFIARGGLSNN